MNRELANNDRGILQFALERTRHSNKQKYKNNIRTLSVMGRKSRWLFAFRTTSRLVGGGIRPTLSGFIIHSNHEKTTAVCTFDETKAWCVSFVINIFCVMSVANS